MMVNALAERYRIAWSLLLGSFLACVVLAVVTPILAGRFVQLATRPLVAEALANQGTVGIIEEQSGNRALFAGNMAQQVSEGTTIRTSTTDTAILSLFTPDQSHSLARVQVYNNTTLLMEQAVAPRFSNSRAADHIEIVLEVGRIRLTLLPQQERPLSFVVRAPHGDVEIDSAGEYSIEASNAELQVSVQEGAAEVLAQNASLALQADQRAQVQAGLPPTGPLDTERNLVQNGDYQQGMAQWVDLEWNVELPDQPSGEIFIGQAAGEPVLVIRREGIGHADAGVRQIIDQDVTDFQTLELSVKVRINQQTLGVCGNRGSECPLSVRIEYEDVNGAHGALFQGFYASGGVAPQLPDVCVSCPPPRSAHVLFAPGQLRFYESENLLDRLRQQDIQISRISNLSLIGSGHAFDVEVVDVALMAKE